MLETRSTPTLCWILVQLCKYADSKDGILSSSEKKRQVLINLQPKSSFTMG